MAIQVRRGTAAAWTSANPTLASGEPGFETDTGLLFLGDGSTAKNSQNAYGCGKTSIWIPRSDMIAATTSGPAASQLETTTNKVNYLAFAFDATTQENAHFQKAMPKRWNEGTVTFQAYWSSTATDTDGVTWGLQGVALSDSDVFDAAFGTAQTVDDACQSTANELYITAESSAITIAGTPATNDLVAFRVFRDVADGNDTATEDALLVGIMLHVTTNAHNDV
jgi:hypothetical protein